METIKEKKESWIILPDSPVMRKKCRDESWKLKHFYYFFYHANSLRRKVFFQPCNNLVNESCKKSPWSLINHNLKTLWLPCFSDPAVPFNPSVSTFSFRNFFSLQHCAGRKLECFYKLPSPFLFWLMVRSVIAKIFGPVCFSLSFPKKSYLLCKLNTEKFMARTSSQDNKQTWWEKYLWHLFLSPWLRGSVHSSLSHEQKTPVRSHSKTFQFMNLKSFITKLFCCC